MFLSYFLATFISIPLFFSSQLPFPPPAPFFAFLLGAQSAGGPFSHLIFTSCMLSSPRVGSRDCNLFLTRSQTVSEGKYICILCSIVTSIFKKKLLLSTYIWLDWSCVVMRGLSPVVGVASHCGGFSCCWALGSRACGLQYLWCTGLVVPQHVGSSWTRDQTHVPCTGRQILNHCTTGEVSVTPILLRSYCGLDEAGGHTGGVQGK